MTIITFIFPEDDHKQIDFKKFAENPLLIDHVNHKLSYANVIDIVVRIKKDESDGVISLPIPEEFEKNSLMKNIIDHNNIELYFSSIDKFTDPEKKYIMTFLSL